MKRSLASLTLWLAACSGDIIDTNADGRDNDCDGIVDELKVCHDGSESFTTLAAGLAAAPDGGGIEVCAGTYRERLAIDGKSVRLNGAGPAVTILDAGGAGPAL